MTTISIKDGAIIKYLLKWDRNVPLTDKEILWNRLSSEAKELYISLKQLHNSPNRAIMSYKL